MTNDPLPSQVGPQFFDLPSQTMNFIGPAQTLISWIRQLNEEAPLFAISCVLAPRMIFS
jgi:hypothetical protein